MAVSVEDAEEDEEEEPRVSQPQQPSMCAVELFTCPDCHIEFTFDVINLPSCSHDHSCR